MEVKMEHEPIIAKAKLTRAQVIARGQERLAEANARLGPDGLAALLLRPSPEEVQRVYNKLTETGMPPKRLS